MLYGIRYVIYSNVFVIQKMHHQSSLLHYLAHYKHSCMVWHHMAQHMTPYDIHRHTDTTSQTAAGHTTTYVLAYGTIYIPWYKIYITQHKQTCMALGMTLYGTAQSIPSSIRCDIICHTSIKYMACYIIRLLHNFLAVAHMNDTASDKEYCM